jgi:phosphoribosylglycinamide formyltransferase-1
MRILGTNFIRNFPNKILNIHPSLLPKYPGLNTHKKVLENKDKEHGVTVHLVDEGLDSGPIIGSMKLKVIDGEKESDLERRIHKIEHYIYPKILSEFQEGKISTTDNKIKIDEVFYKNGKEYFI